MRALAALLAALFIVRLHGHWYVRDEDVDGTWYEVPARIVYPAPDGEAIRRFIWGCLKVDGGVCLRRVI